MTTICKRATDMRSAFLSLAFAGLFVAGASAQAGSVVIEDVQVTPRNAGQYNFSVTLKHGDIGWDHYANAWDVTDLQGNLLGKRVLHHPHVNEQPFTRSQVIQVPAGIKTVQVRAYDSVHGLSEQTYQVNLPD